MIYSFSYGENEALYQSEQRAKIGAPDLMPT